MTAKCSQCGRERTPQDRDYDPIKAVTQGLVGWYSGSDGEVCSEDMVDLMMLGNKGYVYHADIDGAPTSTLTYITFGVQYRRTGKWVAPHPIAPWADCNGYLTVVAPTHEDARRATMELLSNKWSFDYDTPPKPEYAPLGELARLVVQDDGTSELTVAVWR